MGSSARLTTMHTSTERPLVTVGNVVPTPTSSGYTDFNVVFGVSS
jgi:hypothetical protein